MKMVISEMSTTKTVTILSIVICCFAILWQKIFYPMFRSSLSSYSTMTEVPKSSHPSHLSQGYQKNGLLENDHRFVPTKKNMPIRGPLPSPPIIKDSGSLGIIMPLYTLGILIFFIYILIKVLFRKSDDQEHRFDDKPVCSEFLMSRKSYVTNDELHSDERKKYSRSKLSEDAEISCLKQRLVEIEAVMQRILNQMSQSPGQLDKTEPQVASKIMSSEDIDEQDLQENNEALRESENQVLLNIGPVHPKHILVSETLSTALNDYENITDSSKNSSGVIITGKVQLSLLDDSAEIEKNCSYDQIFNVSESENTKARNE